MAPAERGSGVYGVMAEFRDPTAITVATRQAYAAGYRKMDAYTPYPVEELSEALGHHSRGRLPRLVFLGGLAGCISGFLLQYWASVIAYPLNVGGRPLNSWPSFIPITFEVTILVAALTAVLGMLALNGLPQPYHSVFNVPEFALASRDRFFLCIEQADPKFSQADIRRFLEGLDAVKVYKMCRADGCRTTLPAAAGAADRPARRGPTLALLAAALITTVAGTGCRQDMHDQPRYEALEESDFFGDGRASREPVDGTVPRGGLREDDHLYTGTVNGEVVDALPFPLDSHRWGLGDAPMAVLLRGQQRYEIFCSPCHDGLGTGQGMVVRRGFPPAASFHIDRLRQERLGYFFDVISRGFGRMPGYADQVPVLDRWAIVAYVRALQLSQSAGLDDVPAAERAPLLAQREER